MFQMKDEGGTPKEQLSEVEMDNLSEEEFRVIILKMIQDLGKIIEAQTKRIQEISKSLVQSLSAATDDNNFLAFKSLYSVSKFFFCH